MAETGGGREGRAAAETVGNDRALNQIGRQFHEITCALDERAGETGLEGERPDPLRSMLRFAVPAIDED
jgi:hypothetical protein